MGKVLVMSINGSVLIDFFGWSVKSLNDYYKGIEGVLDTQW